MSIAYPFSCHSSSFLGPSHFLVESCTSRCISNSRSPLLALTSEKLISVLMLVSKTTSLSLPLALSYHLRRSDSGILYWSNKLVSNSSGTAAGVRPWICSNEAYRVVMMELDAWPSPQPSPTSSPATMFSHDCFCSFRLCTKAHVRGPLSKKSGRLRKCEWHELERMYQLHSFFSWVIDPSFL